MVAFSGGWDCGGRESAAGEAPRLLGAMAFGPKSADVAAERGVTARSCPLAGELSARIKQFARDAGFDLCGIAPVRDFSELNVFPSWIADGRHGEMKYMEARNEAGELKRANLANVAPWARSVIVCAINYNTAQPYSTQVDAAESNGTGWISRYAWSREDYHDAVIRRLRMVEAMLA